MTTAVLIASIDELDTVSSLCVALDMAMEALSEGPERSALRNMVIVIQDKVTLVRSVLFNQHQSGRDGL